MQVKHKEEKVPGLNQGQENLVSDTCEPLVAQEDAIRQCLLQLVAEQGHRWRWKSQSKSAPWHPCLQFERPLQTVSVSPLVVIVCGWR